MEISPQVAVSSIAVIISVISFIASLVISLQSLRIATRNNIVQVAFSLHAKLFMELDDFQLLYLSKNWARRYYFNSQRRGEPGNFLGSSEETRVDIFLERVNFICMWLLKVGSQEEELLFKKDIHNIYTTDFFGEYFTFLDGAKSVPVSGEYYSFIHRYAKERLHLHRPKVAFREN